MLGQAYINSLYMSYKPDTWPMPSKQDFCLSSIHLISFSRSKSSTTFSEYFQTLNRIYKPVRIGSWGFVLLPPYKPRPREELDAFNHPLSFESFALKDDVISISPYNPHCCPPNEIPIIFSNSPCGEKAELWETGARTSSHGAVDAEPPANRVPNVKNNRTLKKHMIYALLYLVAESAARIGSLWQNGAL